MSQTMHTYIFNSKLFLFPNRTWENDLIDEFDRGTHPPMSPEDMATYTGWYHTETLFMTLYDLAAARPHLFTAEFDPKQYSIIGNKIKPTLPTYPTRDSLRQVGSE